MGGGEGGATVVESGGLGEHENGRNIFFKKKTYYIMEA
jgi:hypothetical protein